MPPPAPAVVAPPSAELPADTLTLNLSDGKQAVAHRKPSNENRDERQWIVPGQAGEASGSIGGKGNGNFQNSGAVDGVVNAFSGGGGGLAYISPVQQSVNDRELSEEERKGDQKQFKASKNYEGFFAPPAKNESLAWEDQGVNRLRAENQTAAGVAATAESSSQAAPTPVPAAAPLGQLPGAAPSGVATAEASEESQAQYTGQLVNGALQNRTAGGGTGNNFYRNQIHESGERKTPPLGDMPLLSGQFQGSLKPIVNATIVSSAPAKSEARLVTNSANFAFEGGQPQNVAVLKSVNKFIGGNLGLSGKNAFAGGTTASGGTLTVTPGRALSGGDLAFDANGDSSKTGLTRDDVSGFRYSITSSDASSQSAVVATTSAKQAISSPAPAEPGAPVVASMPTFEFSAGKTVYAESDPVQLYKGYMEYVLRSQWQRSVDSTNNSCFGSIMLNVDKQGNLSRGEWLDGSGDTNWFQSVVNTVNQVATMDRRPPTNFPSTIAVRFDANRVTVITHTDLPVPKPAPNAPVPQPEILTSSNAFSTFSLNVSDVSFKLAEASLQNGKLPDTGVHPQRGIHQCLRLSRPGGGRRASRWRSRPSGRVIRSRTTASCCGSPSRRRRRAGRRAGR